MGPNITKNDYGQLKTFATREIEMSTAKNCIKIN